MLLLSRKSGVYYEDKVYKYLTQRMPCPYSFVCFSTELSVHSYCEIALIICNNAFDKCYFYIFKFVLFVVQHPP